MFSWSSVYCTFPRSPRYVQTVHTVLGEALMCKRGAVRVQRSFIPGRETPVCIYPSSGRGRLECTSWFCKEKLGGIGALREVLQGNSLYFPKSPLISWKLSRCVSCQCDICWPTVILSSWQLPSWPNGQNPYRLTGLGQAPSFYSNNYIYFVG